jgi:aspartyl-tRNA(Asn)/glutamyl-tRNA(Gln) amidotransferase subunit A
MTDLVALTVHELLRGFRQRTFSPTDVAQAVLDHIERHNPSINAFAYLDPDTTRAQAGQSTARWMRDEPLGPLDGVPVTIKDLILTKGWPTLAGSKTTNPNQAWDKDAPCVARLRESGAVLLGKTTTPEFGGSGFPWSPLTGLTRNPWNLERSCAASSAGAGAATSACFGPLAVGTDAMGSIRMPASFTGTFGFKPTYGRVPHSFGVSGDFTSVGPMTRSVADAALMMSVIAQPDPRDWTALPYDDVRYQDELACEPWKLRIALSLTMGFAEVDPEIASIVRDRALKLRDLGATVDEIDPPFPDPFPIYDTIRLANRSMFVGQMAPEAAKLMDPIVANIGKRAAGVTAAQFRTAMQQRAAYGEQMQSFLHDYDVLITPTMPVEPLPLSVRPDDPQSDEWYRVGGRNWSPFGLPFNLTHQPAASLPCGLTKSGLPVGMQIAAAKYRDVLVLQVSRACEELFEFPYLEALRRLDAAQHRAALSVGM